MSMADYLPEHWLVLPLAVFGFLSSLWLFVFVLVNLKSNASTTGRDRILRTWIDGKEVEIRLDPRRDRPQKGKFPGSLFSAGSADSAKAFISQAAMLVGFTFVFALLWSRSLVIAVAVLAVLASLVMFYLRVRAARRRSLLERQCVDALRLASRSLRAGHPISGVIQVLSDRVPAPTGDLFVQIVQREKMGEPLTEAIRNVLLKSEALELRAFGTALLVQMEAGGNLTETIDRLCDSIVERMVLRRRGRALTADARLSAQIVLLMPFLCVLVFSSYSERYADFVFGDSLGRLFLIGSLMLLLGGLLAVNRLSRIDRQYNEVAT